MRTYHWRGVGAMVLVGSSLFAAAPVIQRPDSIGVEVGQNLEYRVVALDNVASYAATGLPQGIAINTSTGLLSGTPVQPGTYPANVSASNADGSSSTTITINVVAANAAPLIYGPMEFDGFYEQRPGGDMFSCALKATGSPTAYQATSPLPSGWMLQGGTIVGRTTTPGLYMVPVSATNAYGTGSAAITVRIHASCTGLNQTTGTLRPGDTLRVTVQFSRPMSFSGEAPYLEFHTYPDGPIKRIPYRSGNGTSTFEFAYTISGSDKAGDVYLGSSVQPSARGAVSGVVDASGVELGASLPAGTTATSVAKIAIATETVPSPVASGGSSSGGVVTPTVTTTPPPTTPPVAVTPPAPPAPATPPATTPATPVNTPTPPVTTPATPAATATATPALTPTGDVSANTPATPVAAGSSAGAAASPAAAASGSAARLVNLSARAVVREGDSARSFIAGFVVAGSAPKQLLLRASGPTLSSFGVQSALPNPALKVFDAQGRTIAQNEDWSGNEVASAAASTGAFALQPGSGDAALVVTLPPGNYSMQITPNAGSGVALAEIYETAGATSGAPLINISTRAFVDAGENVLTAGFVVAGSAPKRLLVRGVGPALSAFGVSGALANPAVKLFHDGAVVAQNDDWDASGGDEVSSATRAVGAFALPAGSKDAALVVTLAPGSYTAVVSPAAGTSGAGLVEVYELP